MNRSNIITNQREFSFPSAGTFRRGALFSAAIVGAVLSAHADPPVPFKHKPQIGNIFVIAMENHNFTQPTNQTSPQQIFGNPAAPFINSLITPGNSNAKHVSFATTYYNAGMNVHPSEPNYVWAEAGSDFSVHTDADPKPTSGNTFYDQATHLTGQFNAAGVSWKNYQEDVQLSTSPTNSAAGTNGPVNPFYGTTQYNYAVKHNPMAFFAVTAIQNVYPLAQLFTDLDHNAVARYTWITPNQFNDAHSALSGGFTYNGVHYTGDQASVAQGDNFLAQIIPQIMASPAYQNAGVIVIWWDESEGGDDANRTIPEIILSPLAKGNAYASSVPLNHSSDIKTMEEIFGLPAINNLIPVNETNNFDGYNNVATANDLSDLFVPGVIPAPSVTVTPQDFVFDTHTHHYTQRVEIKNTGDTAVPGPLWLVLDNLSPNAALINADGTSSILAPLFSPYVSVRVNGDDDDHNNALRPNESRTVKLEFLDPTSAAIDYEPRMLSVTPTP